MQLTQDKWDAQHYKKNSKLQDECALATLNKIKFKGNEIILDVGCRDGRISKAVAHSVPRGKVIGIDLSPNMIETAKKSHSNIQNLSFQVADPKKRVHLPGMSFDKVPPPMFDYVVSFFSMLWVDDQLSVLKNIRNVLKKGGTIFIVMATKPSIVNDYFFQLEHSNNKWKQAAKNRRKKINLKSVPEFKEILSNAGFTNIEIEIFQTTTTFNSFEHLVKWFVGWIPNATNLSKNEALEFSHEIAKNIYLQKEIDLDQPLDLSIPFLSASGLNQPEEDITL